MSCCELSLHMMQIHGAAAHPQRLYQPVNKRSALSKSVCARLRACLVQTNRCPEATEGLVLIEKPNGES